MQNAYNPTTICSEHPQISQWVSSEAGTPTQLKFLFLWCFSPKRNQTRVSPSKVKGYTKIDIQIPTRNYPPSESVKLSGSRVPEPQFLASPREILGWRTPQTQEPDGLQSIQSMGVGRRVFGPTALSSFRTWDLVPLQSSFPHRQQCCSKSCPMCRKNTSRRTRPLGNWK